LAWYPSVIETALIGYKIKAGGKGNLPKAEKARKRDRYLFDKYNSNLYKNQK
jgi:hypothetical protein